MTFQNNAAVSINVIGCGGCGISIARRIGQTMGNVGLTTFIDTSKSNVGEGEALLLVGGFGAGLIRTEHRNEIERFLAKLTDEELGLQDVNVLCFGLGGGSGSVLGPYLYRELIRRKRVVVLAIVLSGESGDHISNSLKTWQTLINWSKDSYAPTILFDNRVSRRVVDVGMQDQLEILVQMLTSSVTELDHNDRMHFLDQKKMHGTTGLSLLTLQRDVVEDVPGQIRATESPYTFDSVMVIDAADKDYPRQTPRARATFRGVYTEVAITPMLATLSSDPDVLAEVMRSYTDLDNSYKAEKPPQAVEKIQIASPVTVDADGAAW